MPQEGDPGSRQSDQINVSIPTTGKKSSSIWCRLKVFLGLKDCESSYKEALQEVLEEHAEELGNSPEESRMISNLLDFGDTEVREIMIPQTDIVAVEIGSNLKQIHEVMVKEQHTRIPVYEQTLDKVRGFIHVKDLVPLLGNENRGFTIQQILREMLFVPASMKLADLLLKMRVSGVHIAIVVDEYGGTKGLVTLEDLFEEIVGDIQDEHDEATEANALVWDKRDTLTVDAKIRLDDLAEQLEMSLVIEGEEANYETLGGLIIAQLGRVPTRGESVQHPTGLQMEIVEADARRIKKVRLVRKPLPEKVAV